MDSSECLFSVVLAKLGGYDQVLQYLPTDKVTESRRELYFAKITGNFLVHLLSYTYLKDTKSIMLTCKAWYKASQERAFWIRRIKDVVTPGCHFDPFNTLDLGPTLRHKVEFLFRKGWLVDLGDVWRRKSFSHVYLDQRKDQDNIWEFISSNGKCDEHTGRIKCRLHRNNGKWKKKEADFPSRNSIFGTCSVWFHSGDFYTGQCVEIEQSGESVPHGDGKWIFADGEILEGKGIAYMGEPRFTERPKKRWRGPY